MSRTVSQGFLGSLRRLGDGLLAAAQDGLTLLSLEVREEKLRWLRGLVWACAAVFAAAMALVCLSLALVLSFGPALRVPVLAGLAALYGALLAGAVLAARREWARSARAGRWRRRAIGISGAVRLWRYATGAAGEAALDRSRSNEHLPPP